MSVHLIAEAGSNYNGSALVAKRLNTVAAQAGADSVKYQIINTDKLYLPGDYVYGFYKIEDIRNIRRRDELPPKIWSDIRTHALGSGIAFSASVFDKDGLAMLDSFDPPYIKIASCDLDNHLLLRQAAELGRTMVVSTGMSELNEIEAAVQVLDRCGISAEKLVLMHCVSAYPCALRDSNLSFLGTLKSEFGTEVGFSDHTLDSRAACAAVALGATWIEKHFTLDKQLPGLDHKHAATPDELADYVCSVRDTSHSIAHKNFKVTSAETVTKQRARRGLYAASSLDVGHSVVEEDILVVRPEGPVAASKITQLVGRLLRRRVPAFTPFLPEDLGNHSST